MLTIPSLLWEGAIEAVRQPPHDRERVAYFDGLRFDGDGVATTLTLPEVDEHSLNFFVSAESMSRAGFHLRSHDLRRLAQLHTHPQSWTGHSPYDDEMAYSQRDGALSIVVPHFAGCAPSLADCGVHIRASRGWLELAPDAVAREIAIAPSVVDLRP